MKGTTWSAQDGSEGLRGWIWSRRTDRQREVDPVWGPSGPRISFCSILPWSSRAVKTWPWTQVCIQPHRSPRIQRAGWAWPPPSHILSCGENRTRGKVLEVVLQSGWEESRGNSPHSWRMDRRLNPSSAPFQPRIQTVHCYSLKKGVFRLLALTGADT